jgi:hypothetical protein
MSGATDRRVNVAKRPAFESPAALAAPVTPPPTMRRPAATAVGAILVVLRVVAGVVWLVSVAALWDQIIREDLGVDVEAGSDVEAASQLVLVLLLVFGAIVLLLESAFAVLIWFGSNWARITVMFFATISIMTSWIESVTGDAEITVRTTLVTLALDILVLLALSSRNARAYARRPRRRVILHLR